MRTSLRLTTLPTTSGNGERHAHRWRIESPDGRSTSAGVCTVCGAEKVFANAMRAGTFGDGYSTPSERYQRQAQERKFDFLGEVNREYGSG